METNRIIPCNRYLLLEPFHQLEKNENKEISVTIPEEFFIREKKTQHQYSVWKVKACSENLGFLVAIGNKVLVEDSMVKTVNYNNEVYHLVQSNYVLWVEE